MFSDVKTVLDDGVLIAIDVFDPFTIPSIDALKMLCCGKGGLDDIIRVQGT